MAAEIELELAIDGHTVATVKVPVRITAKDPRTGAPKSITIPLEVDTADLDDRLRRGVKAFADAVA